MSDDVIKAAREQYGNDDVRIDDDAETSHADNGTWVQAWVFVKEDEGNRLCEMHEWDHYHEVRRHYKRSGRKFEVVDSALVGNVSYYLVYQASWPKTLRFHYMSDNPDFTCAYDSLAEVGEPFKQWFIDAMNRYSEKNKS